MKVQSQLVVIYDGQCRFCQASVDWISQRLLIDAKAFQTIDLTQYGLSIEQASKSVYVIAHGENLAGARAIAYLLKARGDRVLSLLITSSGPLGRWGYGWVATHRNSAAVRWATLFFENSNKKKGLP